ncbi:ATP-binding cassette domain-containing protein [Tessaracoccus palaemonis]|uniref:ATP-binding cassette domain-containing protein n=1 Tax=Tessaracoccus palaemonis TaxID=2829499 RepID=A0ABX8SF76_9ACTN|nr:ATP-binding cassette domain-containing protein [Tessaracoccus palaemonis]QXT61976.1 ATP-binding cassette domain-containing protein [Tessaracoccus palaemonis]
MSSCAALLSLRGVAVATRDGRELLRVDALDLAAGERVAVTGASGSGKSMLLRALAGRVPAGLTLSGERATELTRIGIVPQRGLDALHPLIPLRRQLGLVTRADWAEVGRVLDRVGLDDDALQGRRPAEMSGGQRQRAALALAVLTRARVILADEPTSALDHDTRDQILDLLTAVVEPEQTLVVATHDEAVADALATRRICVSADRLESSDA